MQYDSEIYFKRRRRREKRRKSCAVLTKGAMRADIEGEDRGEIWVFAGNAKNLCLK